MYLNNVSTLANINAAATAGWVQMLRKIGSIGWQVNLPATGAPIGTFAFDVTDDDNPFVTQGVILGAVPILLAGVYAGATYQPTDGTARLVNFDFGIGQPNPCPTAKWMRFRYVFGSGGNAAGLFVEVKQRGV